MMPLTPADEFAYSALVQQLFANLAHAGELPDATLVVTAGAVGQGAALTLQLRIAHAVVQRVRYHAYGCPHFLAACESLARWLEGRAVSEVSQWHGRNVETELQLPPSKRARLLLLEDVLQRTQQLLSDSA